MKKVFVGSDHGGFELKQQVIAYLLQQQVAVEDVGATEFDPDDDYPQFAFAVAQGVAEDAEHGGIVLCRSGGGVVVVANKVPGIRAVVVRTVAEVEHAVEHDHANVIGIAADWTDQDTVEQILDRFVTLNPSPELRHHRRIAQITAIEQQVLHPEE